LLIMKVGKLKKKEGFIRKGNGSNIIVQRGSKLVQVKRDFHETSKKEVSVNNRKEKSQYEEDFTRATTMSSSNEEAKRRILIFYRRCLKSVPQVQLEYSIEQNYQFISKRIRDEFEKYRHVTEVEVIDMLRWKGEHDLDEYLKQWKTKSHVLKFLAPKKKASTDDFLDRFLSTYEIEEK